MAKARLVTLFRARTAGEAHVVASLLEGAGIPVYVDGRELQDDFAVPRRLMGLSGVEIQVREEHLEEARRVVREAREAGESLDEQAD